MGGTSGELSAAARTAEQLTLRFLAFTAKPYDDTSSVSPCKIKQRHCQLPQRSSCSACAQIYDTDYTVYTDYAAYVLMLDF
jgi:hypothetical protein